MIRLEPPLMDEDVTALRAGDVVEITGTVYTARDAAHRRLDGMIERGEELPVDLAGQVIYYTGPTPASPGRATGSAGPTTSSRMDVYTPKLLESGVKALIGKGERGREVQEALVRHKAIYLAPVGGAGAFLASKILDSEVVAWPELGTEAIHRLEVSGFPAVVVIDTLGNDLYESGRKPFRG